MRTLIELNAALFILSVAILYFILKYRVHVHVQYSRRGATSARARKGGEILSTEALEDGHRAMSRREPLQPTTRDITSALVNLGCDRAKALEVAKRVQKAHPGVGFDGLLREALREAA